MRALSAASFAAALVVVGCLEAPRALAQDEFDDDFGRPASAPSAGGPSTPSGGTDFGDDFGTASTSPAAAPEAPPVAATTAAPATAAATATAAAPTSASRERSAPTRSRGLRLQSTIYGPSGGFHVVDAGSGPAGSFRLSLMTGFMFLDDWLVSGDRTKSIGGTLSVSVTPIEHLEVFASITAHAAYNSVGDPNLIQSLGDFRFGGKGYHAIKPWLVLGGDATVALLNPVGDIGIVWKSISAGFRGNLSFDLRNLERRSIPMIARFNAQYYFDNSSNITASTEDARYASLDAPLPPGLETRNLITRQERFALGINRVDSVNLGIGFEFPLELSERVFLHPIAEWSWGIPVNRQGYVCPFIPAVPGGDTPVPGRDSCLDVAGAKAFPMTATLGARLFPAVEGFSITVAADIGLTGTRTFVRELAPTMPYQILLGATYSYDPQGRGRASREVVRTVEVPPVYPVRGHVVGTVVEQGTETRVDGAVVRFPGRDVNALVASSDGLFATYSFEPGEVAMELSHPEYESGSCSATIPSERPAPPPAAAPAAAEGATATAEPSAPPAATMPEDLVVEVRCELAARPRRGSVTLHVVGDTNAAVANARIEITGPESRTVTTDASGDARLADATPGRYMARLDAEGFLLAEQAFDVVPRADGTQQITLLPRPRRSLVQLRGRRIQIKRQINFVTDSEEILPTSNALLAEIADVILRHPELQRIEIEGHTDDRGGADHNLELSQRRAEAVRRWLVDHGVEEGRLSARGYGSTRPLVPNITSANRARNRRVQFTVLDSAE
ncbi:MAG: OmpA family protein [Polyangiales bacterium]